MRYRARLLTIVPALALLYCTSCAPVEPPPQDPTKEQITLLQKQLLELQKIQNDTKAKLDESTGTIDTLTSRLKTLEERQHIRPVAPPPPVVESTPADTKKIEPEKKQPPVKKKPAKKKAKKKKKAVKKIQPQTQQPQTPQPKAQQPQAQQPQAQQPQQPVRTQQ
jgi:outer membrane biosynthesis protein TonB